MTFPNAQYGCGIGEHPGVVAIDGTSTTSVSTTTDGTANTESAWAELVAATDEDIIAIQPFMQRRSGSGQHGLMVTFGVGPSGKEQSILDNFYMDTDLFIGPYQCPMFPVFIPAGTRLAFKTRASLASMVVELNLNCWHQGNAMIPSSFGRITTYGAITASTSAVELDPPAGIYSGDVVTNKTFLEVDASIAYPIKMLNLGVFQARQTARADNHWFIDIAIGAAGKERSLIEDLVAASDSSSDQVSPFYIGPIPVDIPAGERLGVRAVKKSAGSNGDIGIIIYGVS